MKVMMAMNRQIAEDGEDERIRWQWDEEAREVNGTEQNVIFFSKLKYAYYR